MQRAEYTARGPVPQDVIECVTRETPAPQAGHVLLEMLAAPINPSDVLTLTGQYGMLPPLPAVGGNEGIGRVAALGDGDIGALRSATEDRLHQPVRLAAAEPSAAAMSAALDAGAWCSWLSGSGPTVAVMCAMADAERVAAALPADGRTKVLRIDHAGAVIEPHPDAPARHP
jgi:hypothetical protein